MSNHVKNSVTDYILLALAWGALILFAINDIHAEAVKESHDPTVRTVTEDSIHS